MKIYNKIPNTNKPGLSFLASQNPSNALMYWVALPDLMEVPTNIAEMHAGPAPVIML